MSFAPSRPPAPDSEAHRLTDTPPGDPAARIRALARHILMGCNAPFADPLPGLDAQFNLLDGLFQELVYINAELHGTTEKDGLRLALRTQDQALAAAIVHGEIRTATKIRKI